MQVTEYSICMSVLWSSILILVFYLLRKKAHLISVCSISGIIILYIFCLIRMFVPVEFPWTKVIDGGVAYNLFYRFLHQQIVHEISIEIYQILLCIWGLGTVIRLFTYVKKYIGLNAYLSRVNEIDDKRILDAFNRIPIAMSRVKVLNSTYISTPCSVGIVSKKIIIPSRNYSENELYYILLHECCHLKNNDLLIKLLINVLCSVYWWNPIVYLLRTDLNQTLEIRCDSLAVARLNPMQRGEYLEILLEEFKRNLQRDDKKYTNMMSRFGDYHPDDLVERFQIVANYKKNNVLSTIMAILIAIALLVVSFSFIVQSKFAAPIEDIVTDSNSYEISQDNAYIIQYPDGTYLLHTPNSETAIDEETVEILLKDDFELIKK